MASVIDTHVWQMDDLEQLDRDFRRNLINSITGYKSGNLIGSINADGEANLAIFNSVTHIGANPPYIGIVMRPLIVPRNTYSNIKETGYFTINSIHQSFYKNAHQTSANYPAHLSEFEECGLTPHYGNIHPAPYVQESLIRIGLELNEELHIKSNGTILLIGQVIELQVPQNIIAADGQVAHHLADGVAVVGLDAYYTAQPLQRMAYARPGVPPRPLTTN